MSPHVTAMKRRLALAGVAVLVGLSSGSAPTQPLRSNSSTPPTASTASSGSVGPASVSTTAKVIPPPPALTNLDPGGAVNLPQEVPVTIVYVGLEEGADPIGIDSAGIEAAQPSTARPSVLSRALQGYTRDLGLEYSYSYTSVFADEAFEDAFFEYLPTVANGPFQATYYQYLYSLQPNSAVTIPQNLYIDAVAAEAWLAANAGPMLDVDTSRPTVFFVNWFGRDDFQFHTYAPYHVLEGNPYSYGFTYGGQGSAWGGSTPDDPQYPLAELARTWFYDVSAGPDYSSENWSLNPKDQFWGDKDVADDRVPPVWEYGTTHWFRPFTSLSDDLAKVLRYVAIDGLFTATPAFDPALSPPLLTDHVDVDVNVFTDAKTPLPTDPLATLPSKIAIATALNELDPSRVWKSHIETGFSVLPLEYAFNCTTAFLGFDVVEPCASDPQVPTAAYDLGVAIEKTPGLHENTRGQLPITFFDVPDHRWMPFPGSVATLEQAFTGLQTSGLVFDSPYLQDALLPPSQATMVTAAFYLGLQGSYTTVDPETGTIATFGDEGGMVRLMNYNGSITSNLPFKPSFSQFERDDMDRWMSAVRLQWANRILADIYASPKAGKVSARLLSADAHAGQAASLLASWDLRGASLEAKAAYDDVVKAATGIGIKIESWSPRNDAGPIGFAAWAEDPVLDDGFRTAAPEYRLLGGRRATAEMFVTRPGGVAAGRQPNAESVQAIPELLAARA